MAIKIVIMG